MNFKQSILLLVVAALSVIANEQESNLKIQELLARSNANGCFPKYMERTQALTSKSEKRYNACNEGCEKEKSNIEAAALEERNNLASSADRSCTAMSQCNEYPTAEEVLKCLEQKGSDGAQNMYAIRSKASKNMVAIKESFRLADNKKYKCTNETKEQFDKDVAFENTCLTNCIMEPNYVWPLFEQTAEESK